MMTLQENLAVVTATVDLQSTSVVAVVAVVAEAPSAVDRGPRMSDGPAASTLEGLLRLKGLGVLADRVAAAGDEAPLSAWVRLFYAGRPELLQALKTLGVAKVGERHAIMHALTRATDPGSPLHDPVAAAAAELRRSSIIPPRGEYADGSSSGSEPSSGGSTPSGGNSPSGVTARAAGSQNARQRMSQASARRALKSLGLPSEGASEAGPEQEPPSPSIRPPPPASPESSVSLAAFPRPRGMAPTGRSHSSPSARPPTARLSSESAAAPTPASGASASASCSFKQAETCWPSRAGALEPGARGATASEASEPAAWAPPELPSASTLASGSFHLRAAAAAADAINVQLRDAIDADSDAEPDATRDVGPAADGDASTGPAEILVPALQQHQQQQHQQQQQQQQQQHLSSKQLQSVQSATGAPSGNLHSPNSMRWLRGFLGDNAPKAAAFAADAAMERRRDRSAAGALPDSAYLPEEWYPRRALLTASFAEMEWRRGAMTAGAPSSYGV